MTTPALSWAKVEDALAQEHGTFRLLEGFIALTGMLLQEFEFNVDPPIAPETMLQKMADWTIDHPDTPSE